MKAMIKPGTLQGTVLAPPSKSYAHRIMICAALSDQVIRIKNLGNSDDVKATMDCLTALGAKFMKEEEDVILYPIFNGLRNGLKNDLPNEFGTNKEKQKPVILPCRECGATLRMVLPVASVLTEDAVITGEGRLSERPIQPLITALEKGGKRFTTDGLPLHMKERISGNHFSVSGDVSSQFLSGLLMMSPLLNDDIIIEVTTELYSKPYIQMTIEVMETFGIEVQCLERRYMIHAGQQYHGPEEISIEGDWSGMANFLVARELGDNVEIKGLTKNSPQGDRAIINLLPLFRQKRRVISLKEIPDLLPVLMIMAQCVEGTTVFEDIERIRQKESDRVALCLENHLKVGGKGEVKDHTLIIQGGVNWKQPICLNDGKDHRIIMALAILGTLQGNGIIIEHAESVKKSYPEFWKDFVGLGGEVEWMDLRK